MKVVKRSSLAAGLILAATLALWLGLLGRSGGVAWGDVVDKIQEAHAVRCKVVQEMTLPADQPTKTESHLLMTDSGWTVTETVGVSKSVTNFKKGTQLLLMVKSKLAIKTVTANAPDLQKVPTLLEELKKLDRKGEKSLGEKDLEGVRARGFQVAGMNGLEMEVWVDVKTERPVLVISKVSGQLMKAVSPVLAAPITSTYSEFDWNPQVDPKELTFDVPEGYHLETVNGDASSPPAETDVIALLKDLSDLNGGTFADGVTMMDYFNVMTKWSNAKKAELQKANITGDAARDELMKGMAPMATDMSRAWAYMGNEAKGSDWRYGGQGVRAGTKGTPVLWYKTAAGTWRVFDADLTVHDAKEADLPKGEPVDLQLSLSPPQTGPATKPAGKPDLP